jgi:hypothetical protein
MSLLLQEDNNSYFNYETLEPGRKEECKIMKTGSHCRSMLEA